MVDNRSGKGSEEENGNEIKSCVDCGTTKTPLWRSGPAGPKSLCNACGIKSRKRRGSAVSSVKKSSTEEKKAKKLSTNTQDITSSTTSDNNKQSNKIRNSNNDNNKESSRSRNNSDNSSGLSQSLKKKLVPLGQEVVFQRSIAERLRKRPGEEEQAAMLLMALSCGSCVH